MSKIIFNILISPIVIFIRVPLVLIQWGLSDLAKGLEYICEYIPGFKR